MRKFREGYDGLQVCRRGLTEQRTDRELGNCCLDITVLLATFHPNSLARSIVETGHPVRVLIVEDLTIVREGLRTLLQSFPNLEVVGEAGNGEDGLAKAGTLKPTIVLMDVNMPKMDGVTATRIIKQNYPQIAVIGLTADAPEYVHHSMIKAGAFEVIRKEQAVSELYSSIQRAVASVQPILVLDEKQVETSAPMTIENSTVSDLTDVSIQIPPETKGGS